MKVFYGLIIAFLSCISFSYASCTHPDFAELMKFYNQTGGVNWKNNSGWKQGQEGSNCEPCSWFGVTCSGGRVVSISLSGNNLSGVLPDLSGLSKLNTLDASNNQLSGCTPSTVCSMLSSGSGVDLSGNKGLPYQGDVSLFCSHVSNISMVCPGEESVGLPCDDGLLYTYNDKIQPDCACMGVSNTAGYASLDIQNSVCGIAGTETLIPVRAFGIKDIAALEFTIGLSDPNVGEIVGACPVRIMAQNDFSLIGGNLKCVYVYNNIPVSVSDSSILFYIRVRFNNVATGTSNLQFKQLSVLDDNVEQIPSQGLSGSICACRTSSVVSCDSLALPPVPPFVAEQCKEVIPSGPVKGGVFNGCQGTITYTWTYSSSLGTTKTWTFTYTVSKSIIVKQCPSDLVLCENVNKAYKIPELVAEESCSDKTVGVTYNVVGATIRNGTGQDASGRFNIGDSFINWRMIGECDSTLCSTKITIKPSKIRIIPVTACDFYAWNGTVYTKSGLYSTTSPAVNGCDSIIAINLTINSSVRDTIVASSCASYLWRDTLLTESGFYTYATTTESGCDSIQILHLTIYPTSTSTIEVEACDTYEWNNVIYNQSGTYSTTLQSIDGCDSTIVLNLTIYPSSQATIAVSECKEFVWNGTVYTTSGTYTFAGSTLNGCDSLVTLVLTILPEPCDEPGVLTLDIDDPVSGGQNTEVCIPVRVYNYKGAAAIEFSVTTKDTSIACIVRAVNFHPLSGLTPASCVVKNGTLKCIDVLSGNDLADSTVLFEVCLVLKGGLSECTSLEWSSLQVLASDFSVLPSNGGSGEVCLDDCAADSDVGGRVYTQACTVKPIKDVVMIALDNSGNEVVRTMTDSTGHYTLKGLKTCKDYNVLASKDDSLLNGVNVTDLVILRRHLLGIAPFTCPGQYIAANLTFDTLINLPDLLFLKQMISLIITELPGGVSPWRFVPTAALAGVSGSDVLTRILRSSIFISPLKGDLTGQDFTGIKYGDLNNSADLHFSADDTALRSSGVAITISSVTGQAGEEVYVDVRSNNFEKGAAMEFSLSWPADKLALVSVPKGHNEIRIPGTTLFDESKVEKGILTFLWETDDFLEGTTLPDDSVCYRLKFRIIGAAGNTAEIVSANAIKKPLFVDVDVQEQALSVNKGVVSVLELTSTDETEFPTVSVFPNPTTVGQCFVKYGTERPEFVMVFAASGHAVKRIKSDVNVLELGELPSGIYYLQFQFNGKVLQKKLVLLNKE